MLSDLIPVIRFFVRLEGNRKGETGKGQKSCLTDPHLSDVTPVLKGYGQMSAFCNLWAKVHLLSLLHANIGCHILRVEDVNMGL